MSVKQVIIWRHDLKCRLGKKMAQAGHAALAPFFETFQNSTDADGNVVFKMTLSQFEWYLGNQKKIVLRVDTEADLLFLYQRAKELRIPAYLIVDSGLTEWDEPTKTCISLGPSEEKIIDELTGEKGPLGKLQLL